MCLSKQDCMMTRISFFIPIRENVKRRQQMRKLRTYFRATDFAAPRVMPQVIVSQREQFKKVRQNIRKHSNMTSDFQVGQKYPKKSDVICECFLRIVSRFKFILYTFFNGLSGVATSHQGRTKSILKLVTKVGKPS